MAKNESKPNPNIHQLWPTSILTKRFADYEQVNPALLELFYQHRDKEQRAPGTSYASSDRLLEKYKNHTELLKLSKFIMDSVFELAKEVNRPYWRGGESINLYLSGLWFQITNNYAFHETHIHGNCSWSGVYYVRSGSSSRSPADHKGRQPNGITRFYGPYMEHMAGGHAEYGNMYLDDPKWDSYPQDGKLVVFPSYLKHMVFPYNGTEDRVVVSFHARMDSGTVTRPSDHYGMQ